jgi:hypothetical protein
MNKIKDDLLEYEYNEKLFARNISDNIRNKGKVESPKDIYPDIALTETLTYRTGNVPLSHLLLLYEKLVLYIPPSSKEILEKKWSVPFETVISLCEQEYIIPLIGHITEYSKPHFAPLLKLKPPSIWARGLTLLTELGHEDKIIEKNCPLPIDKMASVRAIRKKYEQHFPYSAKKDLHEIVKRELLTYYADLWLFGEGELADTLGNISNPELIAERLFITNRICSYPVLFGLGGTANFDLQTFSQTDYNRHFVHSSKDYKIIPKDLDILLKGVDLHFNDLTLDKVMEFHSSGAAQELRSALFQFEEYSKKIIRSNNRVGNDIEEYLLVAEQFERKIKEVGRDLASPDFRKKVKNIERNWDYGLRMGGVVVGSSLCFLLENPTLGIVTGTSALFDKLLPLSMKDKIIRKHIDKKFYPGVSNMWKILNSK